MNKAKNISKIGMILSALIIITYNIVYLILAQQIPTLEEQKSILLLGLSIIIVFSPIYLNIILDKFVNIFKGDK